MPRQHFLTILVVLFFLLLTSCANQSKQELRVFKALEESIDQSNKTINRSTATLLKGLDEKTVDLSTAERASAWYPIAQKIVQTSNELSKYVDELRKTGSNNDSVISSLLIKLAQYRDTILATDSSIKIEFKDSFSFINSVPELLKEKSATGFYGTLTLLLNQIKIRENMLTEYCSQKVGSVDGAGFFDSFSAIVAQNAEILKPGDNLEITAGVGSFSKAAQPTITINGSKVALGDVGYASYKTKVPVNPGTYKVPVLISYFNQVTGKDELKQVIVKYTVAPPCNQ